MCRKCSVCCKGVLSVFYEARTLLATSLAAGLNKPPYSKSWLVFTAGAASNRKVSAVTVRQIRKSVLASTKEKTRS
jgi:hypothetical protein